MEHGPDLLGVLGGALIAEEPMYGCIEVAARSAICPQPIELTALATPRQNHPNTTTPDSPGARVGATAT